MKEDKFILKRSQKFSATCSDFHPRDRFMMTRLSLRKQKIHSLWDETRFSYSIKKENMFENISNSEDEMIIQELFQILQEENPDHIKNLNNEIIFNLIDSKLNSFTNIEYKVPFYLIKEKTIIFLTDLVCKYPYFYKHLINNNFLNTLKKIFTCKTLSLNVIKLVNNLIVDNNESINAFCSHDLFRAVFDFTLKRDVELKEEYLVASLRMIYNIVSYNELKDIYLFACLEMTLHILKKNVSVFYSSFNVLSVISERDNSKYRENILKNERKIFQNLFKCELNFFVTDINKTRFVILVLNILKEKHLVKDMIDLNVLEFLKRCLKEKDKYIVNNAGFSISLIFKEFPDKIYTNFDIIELIIEKVRQDSNQLQEVLITLCDIINDFNCKDISVIKNIFLKNNIIEVLTNKLNPFLIDDKVLYLILVTLRNLFKFGHIHDLDILTQFLNKGGENLLENLISIENAIYYNIVKDILENYVSVEDNYN